MGARIRTVSGTTTLTLIDRLQDGSAHTRSWHIPARVARRMAVVLGQPDIEAVTGAETVAAGAALVRDSGQHTEVCRAPRGGGRG